VKNLVKWISDQKRTMDLSSSVYCDIYIFRRPDTDLGEKLASCLVILGMSDAEKSKLLVDAYRG